MSPTTSSGVTLQDPRLFRQACYIDGAWIDRGALGAIDVDNPTDWFPDQMRTSGHEVHVIAISTDFLANPSAVRSPGSVGSKVRWRNVSEET